MNISKAKVERLLITQPFGQVPTQIEKMELMLDGIKYDRHFGRNRNADVRTAQLLPRGIEVSNLRMVTIISSEELAAVSKEIGIDILPDDLEANITLSGFPDLTKMPLGTFLRFPRSCILYVTAENLPCVIPAQNMIKRGTDQNKSLMFAKAAMGKRGITALVFAAGFIKVGDEVEIITPQVLEED